MPGGRRRRNTICPSVWPLLHGSVIAFLTASMSLCAVRAKRCIAYKPDFWASLSQAPSLSTLLLLSMPLNRMAIHRANIEGDEATSLALREELEKRAKRNMAERVWREKYGSLPIDNERRDNDEVSITAA